MAAEANQFVQQNDANAEGCSVTSNKRAALTSKRTEETRRCYGCGVIGNLHSACAACVLNAAADGIQSFLQKGGKRSRGAVVGAVGSPGSVYLKARCNNIVVTGFVDCGSSCTLMAEQCAKRLKLERRDSDVVISSVSGEWIKHAGQVEYDLVVQGFRLAAWKAFVVPQLPGNASLLIGMDVIQKVGDLTLNATANGRVNVQLGPQRVNVTVAVKLVKPSVVLEDFR